MRETGLALSERSESKGRKLMNLNEVKRILGKERGKLVIVENDKPVLVVLSYEDYERAMRHNPQPLPFSQEEGTEETSAEELTIDDLPL